MAFYGHKRLQFRAPCITARLPQATHQCKAGYALAALVSQYRSVHWYTVYTMVEWYYKKIMYNLCLCLQRSQVRLTKFYCTRDSNRLEHNYCSKSIVTFTNERVPFIFNICSAFIIRLVKEVPAP